MQTDVPVEKLPFYRWLKAFKEPPDRFVNALKEYYLGHEIKGAFTEDQVTNYRNVYQHFWW